MGSIQFDFKLEVESVQFDFKNSSHDSVWLSFNEVSKADRANGINGVNRLIAEILLIELLSKLRIET